MTEITAQVFPKYTAEQLARHAMKSVNVVTVDGHLTDISISMILVELKRNGVAFRQGER